MAIDMQTVRFSAMAALLLCGLAVADDDVSVLSWDDLMPPAAEQLEPPNLPPAGHVDQEGDEWNWEEDSFEQAFATPVFPVGVVEELDGTRIKLPGFIVPLEIADEGKVSEFLLVPYFGACIHYPAPPPNQIVYVTMADPIEVKSMWDPVWLTGEIRTEARHSDLASAGYTMNGQIVEAYEY